MAPRRGHLLFAVSYDHMLARAERAGLGAERNRLLKGVAGHVIEIGAGTGLNLEHYGDGVTALRLIEPDIAMGRRLRRRVDSWERPGVPVTIDPNPAERLDLPDDSVDAAVSTLTLCSVRDVAAVLAELRRVLRPGAPLVIIEHVRGRGIEAAVKEVLTPVQRIVAGGCRLNRRTYGELRRAGFTTDEVSEWHFPGTLTLLQTGIAGIARCPD